MKRMVENNNEIHLCRNETQGNTLKTVKQYRVGERVRKSDRIKHQVLSPW
jgi:hypothetical protein